MLPPPLVLSIHQICAWWVATLCLVGLLLVTALNAWRETMKMAEFQAYRQQKSEANID
jgi:hypothetical protein